ncbi:MAG: hypothetical protein A2X77_01525 [Gammaproteobacteria bacterium GWE2_42_36]|nr:MAG: hypothetical protein A2X77_01525 [Gammaproteobacteria bacterium GWE2_42_36]
MKTFNFFKAIIFSFFSSALYRHAAKAWRWKGFLYLLTVLACLWAIIALVGTYFITNTLDQHIAYMAPQVPTMTIEGGILKSQSKSPVRITLPNKETFAIIDAGNQIKDFSHEQALLLVQRDNYQVKYEDKIQIYQYSKDSKVMINASDIGQIIAHMKVKIISMLFVVFYLVGLVFSMLWLTVVALFISAIVWVVGKIMRRALCYGGALAVSFVALTPSIILSTILSTIPFEMSHRKMLCFAVLIIYAFYAVFVQPKNDEQPCSCQRL